MARRTARIELRAAPERERRIRYAAELTCQSLSAFVLDAAADRAEQVLAASSETVVPSDFFDDLWSAMEVPPRPNEALRRLAAAERRVRQAR